MKTPTAAEIGRLRVVKKLDPGSRGAIKLAEQFGSTLVCVRHRVDAQATVRYTTIELMVASARIKPRQEKLVAVHIDWDNQALQKIARAAGATWDGRARVWRMPKRLAGILRLTSQIA